MRVAFASARSSPGVTTTALACASSWPGRVLLVEAAEDGGALAARFGLPIEPGLTTLAAASRHATDDEGLLQRHVQSLPGTERIVALVGPPSMEPAQALLRTSAARLATLLTRVPDDMAVLIDAGRLLSPSLAAPLIAVADQLVVVARPRVEELTGLAHRLPILSELGPPLLVLLVGDQPYGPTEVAETLGVAVAGVLARDVTAAETLAAAGSSRTLARSALLRSATGVVDTLLAGIDSSPPPGPQSASGSGPKVNGATVSKKRWPVSRRS